MSEHIIKTSCIEQDEIIDGCLICKKPVSIYTAHRGTLRKDMRFCTKKCRDKWLMKDLSVERFWKKVNKDGPIHHVCGQCWEWTGCKRYGYGVIGVNYAVVQAHRFSWQVHNGEITNGLFVLHRCDNPPCVNPAHLFLGTKQDNDKDRDQKGRQNKGECQHAAKLKEGQVLEIRHIYQRGSSDFGLCALSKKYGVTRSAIIDILRRVTWKHI